MKRLCAERGCDFFGSRFFAERNEQARKRKFLCLSWMGSRRKKKLRLGFGPARDLSDFRPAPIRTPAPRRDLSPRKRALRASTQRATRAGARPRDRVDFRFFFPPLSLRRRRRRSRPFCSFSFLLPRLLLLLRTRRRPPPRAPSSDEEETLAAHLFPPTLASLRTHPAHSLPSLPAPPRAARAPSPSARASSARPKTSS